MMLMDNERGVITEGKWLKRLAEGSKPIFRMNLHRFMTWAGYGSWQDLVKARVEETRSADGTVRVRTARSLEEFAEHLHESKGLNPATCRFAIRCVGSFLSYAGLPIGKLKPSFETEGPSKDGIVPSPFQLAKVCELLETAKDWQSLYLVRGLALSGLSISDFLGLTWDSDGSPIYGSIRKQALDESRKVIHIRLRHGRKKSKVQFDCWLSTLTKGDLLHISQGEKLKGRILGIGPHQAGLLCNKAMALLQIGTAKGTRAGTRELRSYFTSTLDAYLMRSWGDKWAGHKPAPLEGAYGIANRERGGIGVAALEEQEQLYLKAQGYLWPSGE